MRKQIRLLAAAMLICLGIGQTALAAEDTEEAVRSGKCGDNITWEYKELATAGRKDDCTDRSGVRQLSCDGSKYAVEGNVV